MLIDQGQIDKVTAAMTKFDDATEKLCAVWNDEEAPTDDRVLCRSVIGDIAAAKMRLSTILPVQPLIL